MEIIKESKSYRYGGFWVRFVAYIIDSIVIFMVQSILFFALGINAMALNVVDSQATPNEVWDLYGGTFTLITLLSVLLAVVYYAGMESSSKQATIGKMAFELKVVDTEGNRISFLRGVGRFFSKYLSSLILMIGYIIAAFDSRKQALHDKLANTMVIYDMEESIKRGESL